MANPKQLVKEEGMEMSAPNVYLNIAEDVDNNMSTDFHREEVDGYILNELQSFTFTSAVGLLSQGPLSVAELLSFNSSSELHPTHGKEQSNDTIDSRASDTPSSRNNYQEISTGFSATPDPPLASSSFFDDRLDLEYSELDAFRFQTGSLWSQSQLLTPPIRSSVHCLPEDHRPLSLENRDSFLQPLENSYSPLFEFSGGLGGDCGDSQLWQKHGDHKFGARDAFKNAWGPSSPRVMASKLLETTISDGTRLESDVGPPAEKKRRSMMRLGKREYGDPLQELPGKSLVQVQSFQFRSAVELSQWKDFNADVTGAAKQPPWVCSEEKGSTVMGSRELHTMEQLLVQCASAIEARDALSAQQTIFVMSNMAAMDGDPNERLLAYFLRALVSRASKFAPQLQLPSQGCESPGDCRSLTRSNKLGTVLELTNYIDVMPWYRFGFIAANGAMLEAFEGKEKVHILDLNISHCMQWPTLIEALAERSEGPPQVRLTVCVSQPPIPPLLEVSYDELILRLAKFARSKQVPFEYALLVEDVENLDPSKISIREGEILAVNCLFRLHYVSEEVSLNNNNTPDQPRRSPRDQVLRLIRSLNPAIVTLTEEDANLTASKVVPRLRAAFNYLWIPFDAVHTLLPRESQQRRLIEAQVASKIENLVACEGGMRMERAETKARWVQRMRRAGFEMVSFSEDVVAENRLMLGEHSGCWSLRREEDEDLLSLNWKGHSVSFASAWVPIT